MDLLNYVLISAIVTLVADKEIIKLDTCVIFSLANSDATITGSKIPHKTCTVQVQRV